MSVKIARLKGGEDVIADIKEVSAKEDENKTAIAFMFRDPYTVILDDQSEIEMEMWGEGDESLDEEEPEILASNKEAIEKNGTSFSGWSVDANGKQGIQYSALVIPLINAVQELSKEVERLKNEL